MKGPSTEPLAFRGHPRPGGLAAAGPAWSPGDQMLGHGGRMEEWGPVGWGSDVASVRKAGSRPSRHERGPQKQRLDTWDSCAGHEAALVQSQAAAESGEQTGPRADGVQE